MSVNNTSPTIQVPVSLPIAPAFSRNDVGVVLSTGSTKPLPQQAAYQQITKAPVSPMPAPVQSAAGPLVQESVGKQPPSSTAATATPTIANATVSVAVAPKQIISPSQILSVGQPARNPAFLPPKTVGKHQLPVRSLPPSVSVIPHVVPRTTVVNTVTTALLDPGGGSFQTKAVALQPAIISGTKQRPQPVLMAPGLKSTTPLKFPQQFQPTTFSTGPFQIPNQQQTVTTLAVKPLQTVTGNRMPQPVVVHSIFPPPQGRQSIPLTAATSLDVPRRPSSVLHQPTTTISISVSAKPSSQDAVQLINASSRVSATSSGGKSLYQVSIPSSSVAPISVAASKLTRKVVTQRPGTIVANNIINRTASTSSVPSSIATSVSSFTHPAAARLASITSITTSAVAKVFPQPPSVSGISAHVRTSEFNQPTSMIRHTQPMMVTSGHSASSASTVAATVAAASRTVASVMQPIVYMPPGPGISFPYPAPPATSYTGHGIRNTLNISAPNQNSPIRLSSNLLVMEAPRIGSASSNVAAFTQGQTVLQSVPATQTGASDQSRLLPQNIASSQVPSAIQHVPNMSPKPAILRRPIRSDTSITKKLTFTSETRAGDRSSPIKTEQRLHSGSINDSSTTPHATQKRYSHEATYTVTPNIKPALPGQVKPIVTSNGIGHTLKLQNNVNAAVPYIKTEPVSAGHHLIPNQGIADQKISIEQGFPSVPFSIKTEPGQLPQQRFQAAYHLQGSKPGQEGRPGPNQTVIQQPVSKVRQLQQRVTVTASARINPASTAHVANSPAIPNSMQVHQVNSNTAMHYRPGELHSQPGHGDSKLSLSESAPAGTLKRAYDKITSVPLPREELARRSNTEQQNSLYSQNSAHNKLSSSAHDPLMGLSPRKKPRKQTHVVAEELPENVQMIDDEMSTDDADECEDEQPTAPVANNLQDISKSGPNKAQNRLLSNEPEAKPSVAPVAKAATEYTDEDGVRYVVARERPPINLLNGHRTRAVNNHFTHYSDVKVKEKKTTFHDQCFDLGRLKGWKVKHLAMQLDELRSLDANALERIERVKNDLLQHCQAMLNADASPCDAGCKSPAQIMSLPTSVATTTPTPTRNLAASFKSFSSSGGAGDNSPLTPLERRVSRIREEVLKTEEMAQANIQRCNVIQEQLSEARATFVKALDNRELATKLVEAGRCNQKTTKTAGSNGVRSTKKKRS